MIDNILKNNLIQETEYLIEESIEFLLDDLLDNEDTSNIVTDSLLESDNSEESPQNKITNQSITINETSTSSEYSLLEDIRDGWLGNNNNILIQHQAVESAKCNCPNCCSGILPSNFVTELSDTSPQPITITSSNNNLDFSKIEALLSSYKWNNSNTITYSFYEDDVFAGDYYSTKETNVQEVSSKVKENVREILNWLETIVDIDFVEVAETSTDTFGQLRYMLSERLDYNYAWAYYPSSSDIGGDIHLRESYDHQTNTNGFQNDAGKHGYMSLIHETLHALGLKHPHSGDQTLSTEDDNTAYTVMSYEFAGYSSGTAMPYDIAALQYLYGAKDHNTGDDTYIFDGTTDVWTVNGNTVLETTHRTKQTIWDSNGIDTLDFSQLSLNSSGYSFDLNPGGWLIANNVNQQNTSKGNYYSYGTSIAFDVTLENIIGSNSNDYIIANSAANIFGGYDYGVSVGNDTLVNTDGFDILDLSSYSVSDITQTQNNNDLIIDLGDFGSVTVEEYFVSAIDNRLQIQLEEGDFDNIEYPSSNVTIGEVGRIDGVTHQLQTIQLQGNYTNPVVFAQPLSRNGTQTAIARVTDIQSDSISFYVQEAEHLDGKHNRESFSYMVVEAGTWQLADGTLVEAGTTNSNANVGSQWETINFQSNFTQAPVVLSQVQTTNNSEFIRTRQKNGNATGFKVALEKEDNLKNSPYQQDTVGWLAISSGEGTWDGNYYQATNTGDNVTHQWYGLNLSDNFTETPQVLASIASYDGPDSSGLRSREITGANGTNIEIRIEEDKSLDSEMGHTTEDVNFFAIEGTGLLTAQVYEATPSAFTLDGNSGFSNEEDIFSINSIADI
ncbi:MAG: M10 family metallopeptidase [Xenococcaceae cyanobacterium MO_188.B19]|nr:M10 family metallopeptidase [Xenococcaceae cyanobacterium MO_188.B19]